MKEFSKRLKAAIDAFNGKKHIDKAEIPSIIVSHAQLKKVSAEIVFPADYIHIGGDGINSEVKREAARRIAKGLIDSGFIRFQEEEYCDVYTGQKKYKCLAEVEVVSYKYC